MAEPTTQELFARLKNYEDPFTERKTEGDWKDCLKTAVAFANSLPNGVPGAMFIPATDHGEVQPGANLDHLQMKISKRLAEAYPQLHYIYRTLNVGADQVLVLLVFGSPNRPHFAGPAYVRDGSQSKNASDQQFQELIARRSSKVEAVRSWVGKEITVDYIRGGIGQRLEQSVDATLEECNEWYLSVKYKERSARNVDRESLIFRRVEISYDHRYNRLKLEVYR